MTTKELKDRITIRFSGYGNYKVTIEFRGKQYTCTTNNSLAYDRITGFAYDIPDRVEKGFYTLKGALLAFYNECKLKNGL
jgi:hypothetical protein